MRTYVVQTSERGAFWLVGLFVKYASGGGHVAYWWSRTRGWLKPVRRNVRYYSRLGSARSALAVANAAQNQTWMSVDGTPHLRLVDSL